MPEHLSTAEQILYSTYRLNVASEDECWQASGFFYRIDLPDGRTSDLFVTCAHCLNGADSFEIVVRRRIGGDPIRIPTFHTVRVEISRSVLINHPTEDLVAVFMHPHVREIDTVDDKWPVVFGFGRAHIPNIAEIDAFEEVVMAGCPLGLFDERNNFPITRRGITASHAGFDYGGKPHFLIDMPCHDGSSGSPIFSWSVLSYNRLKHEYDLHLQPKGRLLGVLVSGLEERDPVSGSTLADGHLGIAIRSSELLVLEGMALKILGVA